MFHKFLSVWLFATIWFASLIDVSLQVTSCQHCESSNAAECLKTQTIMKCDELYFNAESTLCATQFDSQDGTVSKFCHSVENLKTPKTQLVGCWHDEYDEEKDFFNFCYCDSDNCNTDSIEASNKSGYKQMPQEYYEFA